MRVRSALLLCLGVGVLGACKFHIDGLFVPEPVDLESPSMFDLSTVDALPTVDFGPLDLSIDLANNTDFALADFSTRSIDLANADLTTPVPGFPSHVDYHYLADSAADWVIVDNTVIDTTKLSISTPFPSGLIFTSDGPNGIYAVLAVHSVSVGTMAKPDVTVSVIGSRPLILVAGQEIHVYGFIDAGGHSGIAGAGGARPASGDGAAANAMSARNGGGGAGYGTGGGTGGGNPPIAGGTTYGDAAITDLRGGSGGTSGFMTTGTPQAMCVNPASGGAGGGVLQLTSRSIVIEASGTNDRGTVSAGGAGGAGGCGAGAGGNGGGGGGGGSGGSIFIEAPSLSLMGRLTAAGGGGGGGGWVWIAGNPPSITNGNDGLAGYVSGAQQLSSYGGLSVSSGGAGYNTLTMNNVGAGGGGWVDNVSWGGGGGGGGGGRIRIRASTAQSPPNTTPAPNVTTELPPTIP